MTFEEDRCQNSRRGSGSRTRPPHHSCLRRMRGYHQSVDPCFSVLRERPRFAPTLLVDAGQRVGRPLSVRTRCLGVYEGVWTSVSVLNFLVYRRRSRNTSTLVPWGTPTQLRSEVDTRWRTRRTPRKRRGRRNRPFRTLGTTIGPRTGRDGETPEQEGPRPCRQEPRCHTVGTTGNRTNP